MKIELLKQRFMHLALLTCLVIGGTMSTISHANVNKIMTDVITALENAQRNDLANVARASKEKLTGLLNTATNQIRGMASKQDYACTVNAIDREFEHFKQSVAAPMANIPSCAQEYCQLRLAIDTFSKVIAILKSIITLAPPTRGLVANNKLAPYQNEFISA